VSNPFETSAFFSARRAVEDQANNAIVGVQKQQRDFQAFERPRAEEQFGFQYQQGRTQVPRGMARRGMFNSGIYRRALSDFARQSQWAKEQLNVDLSARESGFASLIQQIRDQRRASLAQLDLQRQGAHTQQTAVLKSILGSGG
jgi:hypothetical protein